MKNKPQNRNTDFKTEAQDKNHNHNINQNHKM